MTLEKRPFNKLVHIPFHQVQINNSFWSKRQKVNREVSIHLQLDKLEKDHHIDNFRVAAGFKKGIQRGEFYFDSDLYKWLEGASYILHFHNDTNLKEKVDGVVELIERSQTKQGYVNTFYSTRFMDKIFTNLFIMHELYCAGHLIQAAIAHYKATGEKVLLNVAILFADLLVRIFLGGKRKGVPGHEEIEMALIELYRITENDKYLELAEDFINRRGKIKGLRTYVLNQYLNVLFTISLAKKMNRRFEKSIELKECEKKEESEAVEFVKGLNITHFIKFLRESLNGNYIQTNIPIRDAYEPVGHAVRAMYLYCGISDLYSEKGDEKLLNALGKIWLKMVKARIYITGGIGSVRGTEGFGKDFALKNEDSYSETCAAIGNMMWNLRMLNITGHCKYADLIEKLLYNAMLVGQSIDGKKYSYDNPLKSFGKEERQEWFLCACCPPNIARVIASIGGYIYSTSKNGIWIHQYIGSTTNVEMNGKIIEITQKSEFPWNGNIKIILKLNKSLKFSVFLRIPHWCNETSLMLSNEKYHGSLTPGKYVEIIRNWMNNDFIEINFRMEPLLLESDPRIKNNRDKGVLSYGPLIYCLEQRDNKQFDIFNVKIPKNQTFQVNYEPNLFDGINIIRGTISTDEIFAAIPYYSWNNRGPTKMQIWNNII